MRRLAVGITATAVVLSSATILVPGLIASSGAANGTGVYGQWTLDGASGQGTVAFPGTIFPGGLISSAGQNLSVAKTATLSATTPFGEAYGSSAGQSYLSVGLKAGVNEANVTIVFDEPPIAGTYGLAMGDVDAENVVLSAADANGHPVSVSEWNGTDFNYAGGTDVPRWDGATGTITGNGSDTSGASMWIVPNSDVKTITLTQKRTTGFPSYQLWIAADVITPRPEPTPVATATTAPIAPDGKVTICHRTASVKNPYVEMTIDQNAVLRRGHDTHTGGVFPTPGWGDIIPPFPGYAGMNWPAGAPILNNACEIGGKEPIPAALEASVEASASASASASESASASASASESASASSSGSPEDSSSASPEPTAKPTPTITVPPTDDTPTIVSPTGETPIPTDTIPEGGTVVDVIPPKGGTAELTPDGGVRVTPGPGGGTQTVTLVVKEPDGTIVAVPMAIRVGMRAKPCASLPSALSSGTTALPHPSGSCQPVSVDIACRPIARSKPSGDVTLCATWTVNGRSYVHVANGGVVRVDLTITGKQTASRPAIDLARSYSVRP